MKTENCGCLNPIIIKARTKGGKKFMKFKRMIKENPQARLAEDQFGKIQIDRTEEIKNWANRMKDVKQNEKDVKIGIVAANNHYGGYGPGTVDIFRHSMDMEKLSFDVDVAKINRDMDSETRFTINDTKQPKKGKQTSISDFVN